MVALYKLAVNTSFTPISLSNSAATGRNTGGRVIQYCCFVDGLGVQYDARDGICAIDGSVWPITAAVNTSFTPISLSNSAATGRNTGGRVIQYCCFVDGLGVQYDARDGICALDRGCPQRAAKI